MESLAIFAQSQTKCGWYKYSLNCNAALILFLMHVSCNKRHLLAHLADASLLQSALETGYANLDASTRNDEIELIQSRKKKKKTLGKKETAIEMETARNSRVEVEVFFSFFVLLCLIKDFFCDTELHFHFLKYFYRVIKYTGVHLRNILYVSKNIVPLPWKKGGCRSH